MSLDVYLINKAKTEEWNDRKTASLKEAGEMIGLIPLIEEYYNDRKPEDEYVFEANITHNLGKMAGEAGIYEACWRPENISATKAKDITSLLEKGLQDLRSRPDHFKQFDSPNGWGMYVHFVPWVERYLSACKENPEAEIRVSR